MCSILIFAKPDNDHPDPTLDWQKFKRGDVVDIHEDDNFFWGNDIVGPNALGWWRVLVLPGVPKASMMGLLTEEKRSVLELDTSPRYLRANKVNIDAIEQQYVTETGKVIERTTILQKDETNFLKEVSLKAPWQNQNVIGDNLNVIG